MKKPYATLFAMMVIGIATSVPAHANPPPWAPAHGHRAKQEREYRYVYYPARQVYYAPEQQMWFWMNGGNWQFGVNLPVQYRASTSAGTGVQVVLGADRPYVEHRYVEETYGRPWREEHKHKHKEKHNKHGNHDD
jgi:hypothetical protein